MTQLNTQPVEVLSEVDLMIQARLQSG